MKYLLIAGLWTAYCALHSYMISIGFTNLMNRLLKKYYAFYRLFYVVVSLVLLIPLIKYTAYIDNNVIINYGFLPDMFRYSLMAASVLIFLWAFFIDYDSLSFFGIRQIMNIGKTKETNSSDVIKRNGLLSLTRHPMYFACIIFFLCRIHTLSDLIASSVLIIYIFIGTWLEEKKLVLEFGEIYVKYQQEVPMLIPFTKIKVRRK